VASDYSQGNHGGNLGLLGLMRCVHNGQPVGTQVWSLHLEELTLGHGAVATYQRVRVDLVGQMVGHEEACHVGLRVLITVAH